MVVVEDSDRMRSLWLGAGSHDWIVRGNRSRSRSRRRITLFSILVTSLRNGIMWFWRPRERFSMSELTWVGEIEWGLVRISEDCGCHWCCVGWSWAGVYLWSLRWGVLNLDEFLVTWFSAGGDRSSKECVEAWRQYYIGNRAFSASRGLHFIHRCINVGSRKLSKCCESDFAGLTRISSLWFISLAYFWINRRVCIYTHTHTHVCAWVCEWRY